MNTDAAVSIGVDVGGTFTDIVLAVARDGAASLTWTKVPSTPDQVVDGILAAVRKGLARVGAGPGAVGQFMHATTVGTNAVLEEKGAQIGILMTEGFEDVLEIGRQRRSQMYSIFLEPQTPVFLCPRYRRLGVRERIAADGSVLVALDEDQVRRHVSQLSAMGVESLAVCYLFSF